MSTTSRVKLTDFAFDRKSEIDRLRKLSATVAIPYKKSGNRNSRKTVKTVGYKIGILQDLVQ
jgi:hypothetical protein